MDFKKLFLALTALLLSSQLVQSAEWQRKSAPIMTPWGESINPEAVWQEYPRPQLVRSDWMNLNGIWTYFRRSGTENMGYDASKARFRDEILVPFCVESALSGIMLTDYDNNSKSTLMYRRTFTLPASFKGKNVLLHFGAVDWKCTVYINAQEAGSHTGGSDPFTIDITPYLNEEGEQTIVMAVHDPCTRGGQPVGKQSNNPSGIWYTPVSGIWQTVWLEPVGKAYVERYEVIPDVDNGQVAVKVLSASSDAKATITVKDQGKTIATATDVPVNENVILQVPDAKLWSPDSPFLYDLDIQLSVNGEQTDQAAGYFGMRKFSRGMVNGKPAFLLNNKPIYMYGPLDQGWWPDGLLTPPSYEAMVYDLQVIKSFGMNMVRKHIKVEPDLWYEWCDRNGLIVWQDMPNGGTGGTIGNKEQIQQNFYDESVRIVNALKQHPSIAAWVVYNEGWGQDAGSGSQHTLRGVRAVRNADDDPYRLVHSVTGWTDFEVGDILDIHSYPAPNVSSNPSNERVNVCGEFGGITLLEEGHLWAGSQQVYTSVADNQSFTALYNRYTNRLQELQPSGGIWGSVYTQITDVEQEVNGLLTYDRKVLKVSDEQRALMKQRIEQTINYRYTGSTTIVDAGDTNSNIVWRMTTDEPAAEWYQPDFDDTSWSQNRAGFGSMSRSSNRTSWRSSDIWIRRHFTLEKLDKNADLSNLALRMFHDEDTEVYINGVLAISISDYNSSYENFDILPEALAALNLDGDNVMAIHCLQTTGGQYIDAGLSLRNYVPCDELAVIPMAEVVSPKPETDEEKAYLMAYFGEGLEKMLYAYSYDGLNWQALNGERPVFNAHDEALRLRDPFLRCVETDGKTVFHLVHTWGLDNQGIYHWQSEDLINWTAADGSDNGLIPVMNGANGTEAECAWAPEFTYNEATGRFTVYWTSRIGDNYNVYYMTTADWKTFTRPQVLFSNVSGGDVTVLPADGKYNVFFTDMGNSNRLSMGISNQLTAGRLSYSRLFSNTYPALSAAATYPSFDGKGWFMYALAENGTPNLFTASSTGDFLWRPYGDADVAMPQGMRQGSVEVVTREELQRLIDEYAWEPTDVLPTAETEPQQWTYVTTLVDGWMNVEVSGGVWRKGLTGFGAGNPPNSIIKTNWNSSDIYMRHSLDLTGLSERQITALSLRLYHDEDVEVYINGVLACQLSGYTQAYENHEISAEAKATLKADDTNVIAVHCHQTGGGQYIDVGVRTIKPIETAIAPTFSDVKAIQQGIFNLQGQQLEQPQRGINIINGRKVLRK
ncbi:MAG: glycoside hydrolase family 2 [Prevotella sp.]|nr:glycoside hydrolase family 2 [Prevotella sp.]